MDQVPYELLAIILRYCGRSDHAALCRVSWRYHALVMPILYKRVHLEGSDSIMRFIGARKKTQQSCLLVEDLWLFSYFSFGPPTSDPALSFFANVKTLHLDSTEGGLSIESLPSKTCLFPKLESFTLAASALSYWWAIDVEELYRFLGVPNLKAFRLFGLKLRVAFWKGGEDKTSISLKLPPLEEVTLACCRFEYHAWEHFLLVRSTKCLSIRAVNPESLATDAPTNPALDALEHLEYVQHAKELHENSRVSTSLLPHLKDLSISLADIDLMGHPPSEVVGQRNWETPTALERLQLVAFIDFISWPSCLMHLYDLRDAPRWKYPQLRRITLKIICGNKQDHSVGLEEELKQLLADFGRLDIDLQVDWDNMSYVGVNWNMDGFDIPVMGLSLRDARYPYLTPSFRHVK